MHFSSESTFTPPPKSEEGWEAFARPIPPDVEKWLTEFEHNDPHGARGHRIARMYGWTWTELMRYRQSDELPDWMDVNPRELDMKLAQHQHRTKGLEVKNTFEVDPEIESYLKMPGVVPILEWEGVDESWKTEATAKNTDPKIVEEVADLLRSLLRSVISDCGQYANLLRRFGSSSRDSRSAAEETASLDQARRLKHNALIDQLTAFQRYIVKGLPSQHGIRLSITTFDPRVMNNRALIGVWAVRTDYFIQQRDLKLRGNLK